MDNQYLTKTQLTKRWSPRLVEKYFPFCSQEKPNPKHIRGAPMRLYDIDEVRRIESNQDFKADRAEVQQSKIAALKRVQKMHEKLVMFANGVQINVPNYDKKVLIDKACRFYNALVSRGVYSSKFGMATPSREESFLKRIATKYLQCECTFCNEEIDKSLDKIRKDKAYDILKQRINDAIKQKYEWLR